MKLRFIAFLAVTGLSLLFGFAVRYFLIQKPLAQVSMPTHSIQLPLEEYGNHLYLQGTINGTATEGLLLDSGAGDIFISASKAKTLRLKPIAKARIPGPISTIETVDVAGITVQLGEATIRDRKSVIIPTATMTGLKQYFGRSLTGIIGHELFQQLVVEVDYQHHVLHLHHPDTYRYQGTAKPIPLVVQGGRPYVEATIFPYGHGQLRGLFMVDMGSGGALSISAGCGIAKKLIAASPRILRRKLTTIHGASDANLGRVQKVQIGRQALERPLAVFAENPQGDCDRVTGKIGHQILRQFRVVLNYSRQQLILEPNSTPPANPYEYDLSGLWIQATGSHFKTYRVGMVFPNTPAAKAGFQAGDILKTIDGKPTTTFTLAQIKQQLSQSGKRINIAVERGAKLIQADLSLQPLL